VHPTVQEEENLTITHYVDSTFFTVEKWEVHGIADKKLPGFTLVSILIGEGTMNDLPIKKGEHFILTEAKDTVKLEGQFTAMVSWIEKIPC